MAAIVCGKYHRKTFFYGIQAEVDGEDYPGQAKSYPVFEDAAIREKMDDESINFTGLGCFPDHPTSEQVLARIEEIKQADFS